MLACLMTGCAPSANTGRGPSNDDPGSGFGDFSFDLGGPAADTNGVADADTSGLGASASAGAALFRSPVRACAVCHGNDAEGTAALGGPVAGTSAAALATALADASVHPAGTAEGLTDADYANLEAFLAGPGLTVGTNGAGTSTNGPPAGTNG